MNNKKNNKNTMNTRVLRNAVAAGACAVLSWGGGALAAKPDPFPILEKFYKVFWGKDDAELVVNLYRYRAYDPEQEIVTLSYLSGPTPEEAKEVVKHLSILFLSTEEKDKLTALAKAPKIQGIVKLCGYIDEEYQCFVCMGVIHYDDPNLSW